MFELRRLTMLLPLLCVSLSLWGQSSEVSGRIVDASNAAVPSASVTLTRVETGDKRSVLSSSEGYYAFPLILPGMYDLAVQKEGFASQVRTGIKVETAVISTVDVQLAVGAITQAVNVEATVPLLQTETSSVSNVVENQSIVDMPLIDRRSAQLTRMSGFVTTNGAGASVTFAIAGGRGNNENYVVDGGTVQNLTLGVPTLMFDPPVESVQEFNVAISNYSAELGRTGSAVVQMTTKSGTNEFHGSAYEYFRNNDLDARTFFAKTNPILRYNLFGASLGGPIKKNKTQFFFNYEGRREITAVTDVLNVPTLAEDGGNFSADSYVVKNPTTKTPFPGNIIPTAMLDPVGAKLAAFYPAPNVPGAPSGKGNFLANDPTTTIVNDYVARVDHMFNDANRIFGRFLAQPDHELTASIFPTPGTDSFGVLAHNYYYNPSGTWYHNFSPTKINEMRFTYSRRQALSISAGVGTTIDEQIGLTGVNQSFFPTVNVNGFQALGNTTQQQRLQTPIISDSFQDNLSIVRGKQQIKLGIEYRYSSNLDRYSPTAGGDFTFNNTATGSGLAALLLGWVDQASLLATYPLHTRSDSYAAFIQDDWRVTPQFTLNVGLRWDIDQPRWEESNRQNSFNETEINPVSGTPGVITFSGLDGLSKYANNWDLHNFGPRLGFAWNIKDKWVVRGGGAILYMGEYDQATPIVANTGFSTQGSFVSPDNGITPAFILANGMPPVSAPTVAQLTPGYGAVAVGQKPTTSVAFFQPNRNTGYLYQANLDIQRQLKGNILVDLGYLGTFGHDLPAPDAQSIDQVPTNELGPGNAQILRPFPQFSNVQIIAADIGKSWYNGVNLGVQKRYSNGLLFTANYTYSKMLDTTDSRNELAAYPGIDAFTNYYNQASDKGLSGNDIRNRLVFSSVYELPVGTGKRFQPGGKLLNGLIGGWSLGVISELRTGTPLSPVELNNLTNSFSDGVRPNVVGNPGLPGGRPLGKQLLEWFNVSAFAAPAAYTFGDAGRTFGEGPGSISLDTSLLKDFPIRERVKLQFRLEVLNALNHPSFANPNTQQGSPTFGQITSLVAGNQARIFQLGAHLKF
ncbi:MAG: TonB-dependent receptor [Bryobacteraceae bacterium]|jgi:outer membrane receptor protein involved in Fe transport